MKKLLLLASVAAFALACNQTGNTTTSTSGSDSTRRGPASTDIVYVNLDTLMSHYDMFIEMSDKLEEKANKAEKDLKARGRNFERKVADAREKIEKGLVTQATAMKLQEDLQRDEQNLMNFQERMRQELAEENQVMMNNISHSMDKFLAEFNKDYTYGMILSTSGGAPILHANPEFDITPLVIKGLNEQYAKEKKDGSSSAQETTTEAGGSDK